MGSQWLIRTLMLTLVVLSTITLAACELAGDIFEAGAWAGALAVVFVVAIVIFIAAKIRG
jgi:uncharacterized membrane protein YkvI